MRCRRCDYQLWNLASRTCPECGDAFLPSGHTFRPASVEFRCPHCKQRYFGTDARGHLQPSAFTCVGCGRPVTMDEMVLAPAEGVDPEATVVDRNPWTRRAQLGRRRAWWRTSILGMINPVKLAQVTPHDGALWPAWRFATVNILIVMGANLAMMFGIIGLGAVIAWINGDPTALTNLLMSLLGFLVFGAAGLALQLLYTLVWIGLAHLQLKITGGSPRPIRTTSLAILYTSGANLPNAVPCLNYVAWLWWPITAGIALKHMQGVSAWRALPAALFTPLVVVAGFVAGYIALMMWAMSLASAASSSMTSVYAEMKLTSVHQAIVSFERGADPPRHALEMVASGDLWPDHLVLPSTLTTLPDIPAGSGDLSDFTSLPPGERRAIAREAADALPADTIAHRLGDVVFTYHGFNTRTDPDLWIAVISPDPDTNPGVSDVDGLLWALLADGHVEEILATDFARALDDQNALRATHLLAPLPHPDDVRHASPALAPSPPGP